MFTQHPNIVSDASAKSQFQSRSGILTPASDKSPCPSDEPDHGANGGRKRKRDGNTMDDLLKNTFVIRPIPATASVKWRKFQPLLLLPRSHLPLSAIDVTSSAKTFSKSRLFDSHVKVLELEDRMGSQPLVVIAKQDDDTPTLFVVERESRGLYVIFQLGSWINLRQLKAVAVASKQDAPKDSYLITKSVSIPMSSTDLSTFSKKKRLAIEQIQLMIKRPTANLLTESSIPEASEEIENVPAETSIPVLDPPSTTTLSAPTDEVPSQLTATGIFDNIRSQYLEALYISKASLAYFAKGPLSRARAAFHLDLDSNLDINEYVAFLEGLVMSTTFLDKKYRDGVPTCVSLIDIHDHSGEENIQSTVKVKKRKVTKKIKLGKNGLYPTEDTLVRKWWKARTDDSDLGAPGRSKEEIIRERISLLRIREMQLQIILILEILALQPLALAAKDDTYDLPRTLPSIETVDVKDKPVKARKPDHLNTLIDGHLDRLCIWQSLASESMKEPEAVTASVGPGSQVKLTDNIPRDFCVEVIVPFFSARLPERCAAINRKLGGPVAASESKLKASRPLSSSQRRPGAATKRPVPAPREARSLQRVLSDDRERRSISQGPNRKISLMRSATMPSLKRETSEASSLSNIPMADSQTFNGSRGGLSNTNRFARREVDMSNLAPETNPKAKQKAIVDAELKDAILALKRPNRELAGKSFAETVEQRSTGLAHSRKSRKPIRNPFFQNVQINATPKAVRRKDMGFESINSSSRQISSAESSFVPASSLPSIPQSAQKPSSVLPGRNPMFMSVQATPTRRASKSQTTDIGFSAFLPSSPLHVRRSSAQLFTTVPKSVIKDTLANFTSHGIQETPIKKRSGSSAGHSHPAVPEFDSAGADKENEKQQMLSPPPKVQETPVRKETSIYESLGWDDDNDIDDLA